MMRVPHQRAVHHRTRVSIEVLVFKFQDYGVVDRWAFSNDSILAKF
jgi:hypothetical protein